MIQEEYVSFDVAKLLKENGFNEKCQKVYLDDGRSMWFTNFMEGESFGDNTDIKAALDYDNSVTSAAYLHPTDQVAMRWFREMHGISIEPLIDWGSGDEYWWTVDVVRIKKNGLIAKLSGFESYEDAVEAALKYCLEII